MKIFIFATLAAAGLTLALSSPALAGHGHRHGGHFRGSIWIGPYWNPYWYAPPPVVVREPIIVQQPSSEYEYVQRDSRPDDQTFWYYCSDANAYYPYVKKCPSRWMKVVPPDPGDQEDMPDE